MLNFGLAAIYGRCQQPLLRIFRVYQYIYLTYSSALRIIRWALGLDRQGFLCLKFAKALRVIRCGVAVGCEG